ncbi:MAG: hypothetical protein Q4G08_07300 [Capnocytophaga sp.]|nr:hypothetical protein [Capnocytophaga sp.]
MKKILSFCLMLGGLSMNAQTNDVYVIVPNKFEFQKSANEFQLNELAKFLFEKQQFKTAYSDSVPADVAASPCNNLTADVINESGMFSSKLYMTLKDCTGKEVFKSEVGRSREKEFKKSYQEALRNAFESGGKLAQFRSEYKPQQNVSNSLSAAKIPPADQPIRQTPAVAVPALSTVAILYAQPTSLGFQLIDNSPKVVLKIKKTSLTNIYIAENANHQYGILFAQGDKYIFEYEENGSLQQQIYTVKF